MERTTKELVDMDNFERWQAGKPLKAEPKPEIPEPKPPKVKDQLTAENIDADKVAAVLSGKRRVVKNETGVRFIGFDLVLKMKDGKKLAGWMALKDFHEFRHGVFKKGEVSLDKISI